MRDDDGCAIGRLRRAQPRHVVAMLEAVQGVEARALEVGVDTPPLRQGGKGMMYVVRDGTGCETLREAADMGLAVCAVASMRTALAKDEEVFLLEAKPVDGDSWTEYACKYRWEPHFRAEVRRSDYEARQ